ncbi:MAG: XdhC family protein [Pyrinomonadaceae bacterium]|nr:XdhC family protein [Pyrinomonadaceae bacterium]
MNEIQEILRKISKFAPDEKAILATVVDVVGSGYRRAGARMLIDENGFSIGTVSGGCLEADVLERAKKVLRTDAPTVITYDTSADENSVFGLGMGCRGVIRVLLEAVARESSIFNSFKRAIERREREVVATLISAGANQSSGGRVFYSGADKFDFVDLPESIKNSAQLKNDCRRIFDGARKSAVEIYESECGAVEFLIEAINPPLSMLLFGAGFDALPVVRFAKELGWRVTVVDHRAAFANSERLPQADQIFAARVEDLPEELFADENSAAVIMTHNYNRDLSVLFRLLNSNCRYIGALGPKTRTENLVAELRAAGRIFDEKNLEKLHTPIGLDIGSETPAEIALAVVAEIKSVISNRSGGLLRDRNSLIND